MADLDVTQIDRQAWAWRKKLIEQRCGLGRHAAKRNLAGLFLEHGMPDGPLPWDRPELIRMSTCREAPSKAAFVTLALVDYIEDQETLPTDERTAKLPYQLAWVRAGFTLIERTGLPAGLVKARWPDVAPGALERAQGQLGLQRHVEPGGLRPVRLEGRPDLPGRPDPEGQPVDRPPLPTQEPIPGLDIEPVSSVLGALGGVDLGAGVPDRRRRPRAA